MYSQAYVRAGKSCFSQLERSRPWSWTLKRCCGRRMGPLSGSTKKLDSGGQVISAGCARESVPEKPAGSPKISYSQSQMEQSKSLEETRRHYCRRHWRIGRDGRIRTARLKAQCKGSVTATEKCKIFGREQRLRTSFLTRERPERGEEQEILQGKSDELHSPTPQDDSTLDDEEAKNDFKTITRDFISRHHVEPRVKLYVRREESIPVPSKYIDVARTTCTSLDVLLEKQIEDYWNVDGEKELSEAWTGFTRFVFLNDRPLDGYTWSGRRLTRKQTTSRPDTVWPDMWKHMSDGAK